MNKMMIKSREDLLKLRDFIREQIGSFKKCVYVCGGAGCVSSHCDEIVEALKRSVERAGLDKEVRIVVTGCIGLCAQGPCMVVDSVGGNGPDGVFYGKLTPEKVQTIVTSHLKGGEIVTGLCYYDEEKGAYQPYMKDIGFFSEQVKIALRNCGRVDFGSIEDYIANDGYQALAKVLLDLGREKTVQEMIDSGLRGRGGAGFPTGIKWQSGMKAPGDEKYKTAAKHLGQFLLWQN
jgi:(2Fe-2S) ferredoxin